MEKNTFKVLARYNEVTYCKTTSAEPKKHLGTLLCKVHLVDFTKFSAKERNALNYNDQEQGR
jgi:hypothetical protein